MKTPDEWAREALGNIDMEAQILGRYLTLEEQEIEIATVIRKAVTAWYPIGQQPENTQLWIYPSHFRAMYSAGEWWVGVNKIKGVTHWMPLAAAPDAVAAPAPMHEYHYAEGGIQCVRCGASIRIFKPVTPGITPDLSGSCHMVPLYRLCWQSKRIGFVMVAPWSRERVLVEQVRDDFIADGMTNFDFWIEERNPTTTRRASAAPPEEDA